MITKIPDWLEPLLGEREREIINHPKARAYDYDPECEDPADPRSRDRMWIAYIERGVVGGKFAHSMEPNPYDRRIIA